MKNTNYTIVREHKISGDFKMEETLTLVFLDIISKICNFYILCVDDKMPESNKWSLQLVNCWSTIPFLQIRWVYFCGESPQRSNICGNVKTTFVILLPLRLLTYINPVLKTFQTQNPRQDMQCVIFFVFCYRPCYSSSNL